jgi:sugar phosphate permease
VYESQAPPVVVPHGRWGGLATRRVSANVWFLGFTSLFTDISSEMVASVLPLYLVVQLGLSPLAFGAIDGLSHAIAAISRWSGGLLADRWRRHKEIAALGYGVSALCRLALLAAGTHVPALGAVVAADRIGKGIRTPPRDALISLSAPANELGTAFGVHRSLDAAGAMLGPLVAFAVLAVAQARFDVVFVSAFSIAVVGLGVLVFFVDNPPAHSGAGGSRRSIGRALSVVGRADFRRAMVAVSALAAFTIGDGFVFLALGERMPFPPRVFPLLFVATSLAYLMLAAPAGWLADRVGRVPVLLGGHLLLALTYVMLIDPPSSTAGVVTIVVLLGAYYAATDGVLPAMASRLLPEDVRGSGLALVGTAHSLGRVAAAVVFGWCWTQYGRDTALSGFAAAMAIAALAGWLALRGSRDLA